MVRISAPRRLFAVSVAASLALFLTANAQAQTPPWTAAERAQAIAALGPAGEAAPPAAPDAALEAAVVRYATIELGQRIRPTEVERLWAIAPPPRDVAAELAGARSRGTLGTWLAGLSPPYPEYRALQGAAARYRAIAAKGGWTALPAGPLLREGDRGPQVKLLRERLAAEGYGAAVAPDQTLFDLPLQSALVGFQDHHGLFNDGILHAETRAALNISARDRLAQIEANLERWRWLPHVLPADRFEVDIAAATGRLIQGGRVTLQMKVVVGDPRHLTPSFASHLDAVVLNPPWNVPASIAEAEILPKAAKDPHYLARNDFTYVDGRLQQRAGPKSALGQFKFDLPSPFGVYLHDTPVKSAFSRQVRALSHGCMRLEKPRELAGVLLGAQGWTSDGIAAAIATGKTQAVPLKTDTALYVLYWTAVVDERGAVSFRPDVYGWDRKLIEALGGPEVVLASAGLDDDCAGGLGAP